MKVINVVPDFGLVADPNYDNGSKLMNMRAALAGDDREHYKIVFPYLKQWIYSDNRWLHGINSYELDGNYSAFRSMYDGTDEAQLRSFFVGEMLQNNVLEVPERRGTKLYTIAEKFNTVKAGSNFVELKEKLYDHRPGDPVVFYAGNYADGSNYPPPARAEWRKIDWISGNFIFLDYPLERDYFEYEWDNDLVVGGGCGKPRMLNLRLQSYSKFAKFTNLIIGRSVSGKDSNFAIAANRVEVVGCIQESGFMWPSESDYFSCKRSELDKSEFDKMINTAEFDSVKFRKSMNGGGSANKIIITNSYGAESARFDSRYVDQRKNHIRNNDDPDQWISTLADYPARNTVRRYTIDELTFSSGENSRAQAHIGIAPIDDKSSMRISYTVGRDIVTNDFNIRKQLEAGTSVIFNEDGSDGGLITEIVYNGTNGVYWIIRGDWREAPAIGQVWKWCHVCEVIDMGGHRVLDGKQLWHENSLRWQGNQSTGPIKEMHLTEDDFIWKEGANSNRTVDMYAFIESIECKILRPYGHNNVMINLKEESTDTMLTQIGTGLNGSTYVPLSYANQYKWVKQITMNTFSISGPVTPDMRPKINWLVKWRPFR